MYDGKYGNYGIKCVSSGCKKCTMQKNKTQFSLFFAVYTKIWVIWEHNMKTHMSVIACTQNIFFLLVFMEESFIVTICWIEVSQWRKVCRDPCTRVCSLPEVFIRWGVSATGFQSSTTRAAPPGHWDISVSHNGDSLLAVKDTIGFRGDDGGPLLVGQNVLSAA